MRGQWLEMVPWVKRSPGKYDYQSSDLHIKTVQAYQLPIIPTFRRQDSGVS